MRTLSAHLGVRSTAMLPWQYWVLIAAVIVGCCWASPSLGDDAAASNSDLAVEQGQLADRFDRLEMVIGQLAELLAAKDPHRAQQLRETLVQSRQLDIEDRFDATIRLLEEERLAAAARNQVQLQGELGELLKLLLKENVGDQVESRQRRIRHFLRELGRILRLQKGIQARTVGGDDVERLGGDQQRVADQTGKLGDDIAEAEDAGREQSASDANEPQPDADAQPGDEGSEPSGGEPQPSDDAAESPESSGDAQPSQGQSPGGDTPSGDSGPPDSADSESQQSSDKPSANAVDRLRAARQDMQRALEELEKAQRDSASQQQRDAIRNLEQAKAELERILRQLREEEMEQKLALLAARFRRMLDLQLAVYDGTMEIDSIPDDRRGHEEEIAAAQLSRKESLIVHEADKAMVLLREEGSSVAFPEVISQMREDMVRVADRLSDVSVGEITQALEQDIIETLEEAIGALDQAMEELERNRTQPGQTPMAGAPPEPPLVAKIAELKMIRSLQLRINRRTRRYGDMIAADEHADLELAEALTELAERQKRVYKATQDLSLGRND